MMKERRRLTWWRWAAGVATAIVAALTVVVPDTTGKLIFGGIAGFLCFFCWNESQEIHYVEQLLACKGDGKRIGSLLVGRIKEPLLWSRSSHVVAIILWILLISVIGVMNLFTGSTYTRAIWAVALVFFAVRIEYEVRAARKWKASKQDLEVEFI